MKGNMHSHLVAFSLVLTATVSSQAIAQTTTSESGSNSAANSGSLSGATSSSNPTNINAPVNEQGNLTSTSASGSDATSSSTSGSNSNQSQGQEANNAQTQGQVQGQTATSTNQQGVAVTFNSTNHRTQKVYTNNAIPLAASSSFSSDYCGGTASGGASAAPIGISIGGSGPVFDKSCQSLRRAEKFGMAAANASNLGQAELAGRLMSMMIWSICTSDSAGPKADKSTAQACSALGLMGSGASEQAMPGPAPDPAVQTATGSPTAEAASRQPAMATNDPRLDVAMAH